MTTQDEDYPDTPPDDWVDETGKSWRLRVYGPGPRSRKLFLNPDVRVMLWSYAAPARDVPMGERAELWRRVSDDDDAQQSTDPAPCGRTTLYTFTDGKGGNVLIVGEPRW